MINNKKIHLVFLYGVRISPALIKTYILSTENAVSKSFIGSSKSNLKYVSYVWIRIP